MSEQESLSTKAMAIVFGPRRVRINFGLYGLNRRLNHRPVAGMGGQPSSGVSPDCQRRVGSGDRVAGLLFDPDQFYDRYLDSGLDFPGAILLVCILQATLQTAGHVRQRSTCRRGGFVVGRCFLPLGLRGSRGVDPRDAYAASPDLAKMWGFGRAFRSSPRYSCVSALLPKR